MKTPYVRWPEKEDYEMAMESLYEKVHDPMIKHGKIHKDQTGTLRYGGANLYVTLYRIDNWMIRCFCRNATKEPPDDILPRYRHISNFCQKHISTTPTLVPITYVDNAIEVDFFDRSGNSYTLLKTEVLPFVRMEFITGLALGSFIKVNYKQQTVMEELCNAWLGMVNDLKRIHMAHGDLDLTNVLVTQTASGLVLKLIDYDNAWVPTLHTNYKQTEVGHEHFQHPAFQSRNTRPYDEHMDNFSMLTMYISLKMLSLRPGLYTQKDWGPDDTHHLLLTHTDYEAEMNKKLNNITRLHNFHIKELDPLLKELSLSLQEKRQARNLLELLSAQESAYSRTTPGTIPGRKETSYPSAPEELEDIVHDDWNNATSYTPKEGPFVKPIVAPQPSQSTPWAPTQPATSPTPLPTQPATANAQAQVQHPNTTVYAPPAQKRSRAWRVVLIIILIIILIVAILLWISSNSHAPTNPASIWSIKAILPIHTTTKIYI